MKYYTAEEIEQLKKNLSELNYEELLEYEQYLIDQAKKINELILDYTEIIKIVCEEKHKRTSK